MLAVATASIFLRKAAAKRVCKKAKLTGFVTDVEGDFAYWSRYVGLSRVLRRVDGRLELKDGCHLVFGGDSVDRGTGDLRFLKELLTLKSAYPDRVHLILGNRDINKMRLTAELCEKHWLPDDGSHPGVYWVPGSTPAAFQQKHGLDEDNRANRLKWMLKDNLGSPDAFEFRRVELSTFRSCEPSNVSDDEVLESYLQSVAPYGLMTEYLQQAQLAAIVGDCLFVHGACLPRSIGKVPPFNYDENSALPFSASFSKVDCVHEWVAQLNLFASRQVQEWIQDPYHWPGASDRGGEGFFQRSGGGLLRYGMNDMPKGQPPVPGVVYANYLVEGNPQEVAPEVEEFVSKGGLRYILTGHQPHGDAPVIMQSAGKKVMAVSADTSYAKFTKWLEEDRSALSDPTDDKNTRGLVAFEVCVEEKKGLNIHGNLSDGTMVDFTCFSGDSKQGPGDQVGKWWIKGSLPDGRLVITHAEGWDVVNQLYKKNFTEQCECVHDTI